MCVKLSALITNDNNFFVNNARKKRLKHNIERSSVFYFCNCFMWLFIESHTKNSRKSPFRASYCEAYPHKHWVSALSMRGVSLFTLVGEKGISPYKRIHKESFTMSRVKWATIWMISEWLKRIGHLQSTKSKLSAFFCNAFEAWTSLPKFLSFVIIGNHLSHLLISISEIISLHEILLL